MAKVNLKKDWFAPDGTLYLVVNNPHNFPWGKDELPKTAEVLSEAEPAEEAPKPTAAKK